MSLSVRIDTKAYRQAPELQVLQSMSFDVEASEFVAVIGPSGCGKSTLLHIVAGLDTDFDGRVEWRDGSSHHRLGYVFQNPRLLPWLKVRDNVRLVVNDAAGGDERVDRLLEAMGLSDFAAYHPNRVSLGMQRRVALARAFAVEPELLLMDEPFVSLDSPTAGLLRALLLRVWSEQRSRVLFVTHNLREAVQLADRILFLSPTPARVVAEASVPISRAQRGVTTVVDRCHEALRQQFDEIYGPNPL